MDDLQSSRIHSRLIKILTYVRRTKTRLVTERQIVTHTLFHFESDSGLTKLEVSPGGGGSAGVG